MRLNFLVLCGRRIGERLALEPPEGGIGSDPASSLWLPDDSVLPQHGELRWQAERWWLTSRGPTCALDDEAMGTPPRPLLPRGKLQVGNVTLQYWQEAAPQTVSAEPTLILAAGTVTLPLPVPTSMLAQMAPMRAEVAGPGRGEGVDQLPTLILPAARPPAGAPERAAPPTMVRLPAPAVQRVEPRREAEKPSVSVPARPPAPPSAVPPTLVRPPPPPLPRPEPQLAQPDSPLVKLKLEALALLDPFSDSLQQASEALVAGDRDRARQLLRAASFAIGDLRSLFEAS